MKCIRQNIKRHKNVLNALEQNPKLPQGTVYLLDEFKRTLILDVGIRCSNS